MAPILNPWYVVDASRRAFRSGATGTGPRGIWLGLPCPQQARLLSRVRPAAGPMEEQEEQQIRAKVRDVLRAGKLPNRRPGRTWGGPGVGVPCAVCDLPVTQEQLELEIQFAHDGGNPGLDKYHVHVRCFAAWEFERRRDGHR